MLQVLKYLVTAALNDIGKDVSDAIITVSNGGTTREFPA